MAQANVETVRGVYERWGEGDFRTLDEGFDPQFLLVMRPEFPESGTYLGLERVGEYMRGFLEPWTRITIEAEELIEAGDSVVAAICQRGVGSGSGAETDFRYFHVWTFRGAKLIRMETVRERTEALALVGLDESGA